MQPPNQHEASGRSADSAERHEVKPMDGEKEEEKGTERKNVEGRKWGAGKHLGPKKGRSRNGEKRRETRRQNKCVFFYDSLYLDATAGYFVSERITSAMYIGVPFATSHRIYRIPFFRGIIGHRLFRLPRAPFAEGNTPMFRHYKFVPRARLTELPLSRGRDSRGRTHKTFPVSFLPSVMFPAKEGLQVWIWCG